MVRLLILLLALTFHWPIAGWSTSVYAEENDFTTWLELIRTEAIESGVQEDILDEALGSIELRPRIVELDRNQPEGRQSFQEYLSRVVPKHRVLAARKRLREQSGLLKEISEQYDVQPRFMVALWGLESDFGRFTGGFPVIDALATLAFDGRRSAFFRSELIDALRILSDGDVELAAMTGSWAGAMGQTQFMPSSYHFYAVDHDQDGRKDIWSSKGDIFASIANYLHTLGWKDDQTWGREVILPKHFDLGLTGLDVVKSISAWQDLGVRRGNGDNLPTRALDASIVLPDGEGGTAFMVYQNFRTTLKWNRSIYFALSVGILADGMLGH